jgi:hypothetical protein
MAYLIIALLNVLAYFFVPAWWPVIPISLVVSFVMIKKPGQAFLGGFTATAAVWLFFVLIQTIPNKNILAAKLAPALGSDSAAWLIFLTTLLGGLLGGYSAYTGYTIRKLITKNTEEEVLQTERFPKKKLLQTYKNIFYGTASVQSGK